MTRGGIPVKHFQQGSKGCGAPLPKRDPPASAAVTDKLPSSCAVLQRKEQADRLRANKGVAFAPGRTGSNSVPPKRHAPFPDRAPFHSPWGEPELKGLL